MKIVTNTRFMNYRENDEVVAIKKAMTLIKEAGFDAYDLSLTSMKDKSDSVFCGKDYLIKAQEIKNAESNARRFLFSAVKRNA